MDLKNAIPLTNVILANFLDRMRVENLPCMGGFVQESDDTAQYAYMGWTSKDAEPYEESFHTLVDLDIERVVAQAFSLQYHQDAWYVIPNTKWSSEQWEYLQSKYKNTTEMANVFIQTVYQNEQSRLVRNAHALVNIGLERLSRKPYCNWIDLPELTVKQYQRIIEYFIPAYRDCLPDLWAWIAPYLNPEDGDKKWNVFYKKCTESFLDAPNKTPLVLVHAALYASKNGIQSMFPWFHRELLKTPELLHEMEDDAYIFKGIQYQLNTPLNEKINDLMRWIDICRQNSIVKKLSATFVVRWLDDLVKESHQTGIQHNVLNQYTVLTGLMKNKRDMMDILCSTTPSEGMTEIQWSQDMLTQTNTL